LSSPHAQLIFAARHLRGVAALQEKIILSVFLLRQFALAKRPQTKLFSKENNFWKSFCEWNLLDEQRFAKLVAPNERFAGAVTRKQILDFAVLVDLLRRANYRRRNYLQRARIRHAVALETFRFFDVEHGEHQAARA
jgi:hypothetical protein